MAADDFNAVYQLSLALALGLIIGVEREWRERDFEGGRRPAGLRTFGLIGLSGGGAALVGDHFPLVPAIGLAFTTVIMVIAYWRRSDDGLFMGVTTIFAAAAAYLCGLLAVTDYTISATAIAVATAMILGAKERLHGFVRKLNQKEIFAALQFILIAGVILPLMPNRQIGPYDAVNLFEIWLMAVLISGLSFFGYIGLKALSARQGILGTAILGGFVSSTAVTVSLAQMARQQPELHRLLSVGIISASTIMFARVGVIASIISPSLSPLLGPPIAAAILVSLAAAFLIARASPGGSFEKPNISNPLDVGSALIFAGLLGVIMVGSRALESVFGPEGIYAISIASGLADVDAITLSLGRFARDELSVNVAAVGILLAAVTNTIVKIILAVVAGGRGVLGPALATLTAAIFVGTIAAYFTMR